ncbi:hypothetical protein Droror1_Dr00010205 [Drosera rotundifolia]
MVVKQKPRCGRRSWAATGLIPQYRRPDLRSEGSIKGRNETHLDAAAVERYGKQGRLGFELEFDVPVSVTKGETLTSPMPDRGFHSSRGFDDRLLVVVSRP